MIKNMNEIELIFKAVNYLLPNSNQFKRDFKKIFRINLDSDLNLIIDLAKTSFKDLTVEGNKIKSNKKDNVIHFDFYEFQKIVIKLLEINDNIRNEFLNNENLKDNDTQNKYKTMLAHYVIINIKEEMEDIIKEKSKNYNND